MIINIVNKCYDASDVVPTHQQVELVIHASRWLGTRSSPPEIRDGPKRKEVTQWGLRDKGEVVGLCRCVGCMHHRAAWYVVLAWQGTRLTTAHLQGAARVPLVLHHVAHLPCRY